MLLSRRPARPSLNIPSKGGFFRRLGCVDMKVRNKLGCYELHLYLLYLHPRRADSLVGDVCNFAPAPAC